MSVIVEVTLPDQPASGDVTFVPLGGNGWSAPWSMFYFSIDVTGDVSGGIVRVDVNRDERFEHLVDFLEVQHIGSAGVFRMDLFRDGESRAIATGLTLAETTIATRLWSPPAIIDPDEWKMEMPNIDGEVSKFKGVVYNFRMGASHQIPLPTLLASVRRASSIV